MIEPHPPEGVEQPESFAFTEESLAQARREIAKYPEHGKHSALIALLDIAQRQHGWLPVAAMQYCADFLGVPRMRAYECASFYTMLTMEPVGTYYMQLCGNISCWLCGCEDLKQCCKDKLGIEPGETSSDGKFTLVEVECLGACVNAPMVQINDDYYEDLNYERLAAILDKLSRDEAVTPGPQIDRFGCCPPTGPTTLTSPGYSAAGQAGGEPGER